MLSTWRGAAPQPRLAPGEVTGWQQRAWNTWTSAEPTGTPLSSAEPLNIAKGAPGSCPRPLRDLTAPT